MSDSDGYVAYSDEECNYIVIRGEEIILNNKGKRMQQKKRLYNSFLHT